MRQALSTFSVVVAGGLLALLTVRAVDEGPTPSPGSPLAHWLDRPAPTVASAPLPPPTRVVAPRVAVSDRPLDPGRPRRLTGDGCCAGAWWSEDSHSLRYVDRVQDLDSTVIYGVDVWPPGAAPEVLATEDLEDALAEPLVVRPSGRYAMVEDVATGDRWPLPTDGNPVLLSPDGTRAVWWDMPRERVAADSPIVVHGSDIYGFDLVDLVTWWGAEVISFLPDSERVLIVGRRERQTADRVLSVVDVDDGSVVELAEGPWLSEVLLSPDGEWAVYSVLLDRRAPDRTGVWAVPTSGGQAKRLPFVGAYRWREGHRLAYIPMQLGAEAHELWELDVATDASRLLLGRDVGMRVVNNDWSISPDGQSVAYRSTDDGSVWVVDLP